MDASLFVRRALPAVASVGLFIFLYAPGIALGSTSQLASAPYPCNNASTTPFLTGTASITNDPDSANSGGNWATDAFTENITVWMGADGTSYCAQANTTDGTFVTTGPTSPNAGAPLRGGITGTFVGGETYTFASTSLPALNGAYSTSSPTTFTLPSSSTAGFSWWVNQVFPGIASSTGSSYTNTYWLSYTTANNGSWIDSDPVSGGNNTGDITTAMADVYVDATNGSDSNDGTSGSPVKSINQALSLVADDGTVHVAAGSYDAFSVVGKTGVTIEGAAASSTIIAPTAFINTHVGHKYTADMQASVFVNNSTGITLKDLTIGSGSTVGSNPDALLFWNDSTGTTTDSVVEDTYPINGVQTGQGIAVDAGSSQTTNLSVDNTAISGFQKNGIDVEDGNSGSSSGDSITLSVIGGSITGAGATTTIAQNGIVLWNEGGGTVTGSVNGTSFSDFEYATSSAYATGILVYGGATLTSVSNSTFSNNNYHIALVPGAASTDATSGNTFDGVSPSTATLAQLGTLQDELLDQVSNPSYQNIFVLPNSTIANTNTGIEAAVNAAPAGGTVYVAPGTYTEQVNIGKDLTLQGAGNTTVIDAPDTLSTFFSTSVGSARPVVYAHGANVTVKNLEVNGLGKGNANSSFAGIGYYNAGGTVSGTTVTGVRNQPFDGDQNGTAIYAINDATTSTLTISGNTVSDYEKNGIAARGTGLTADISGNTVTGQGAATTTAQNGIEIAYGAGGSVTGNTVSGNDCTLSNPSGDTCTGDFVSGQYADGSAGIIIYAPGSASVTVGNNTLTENQIGVWTVGASAISVDGNTISGSNDGLGVSVWDTDQFGAADTSTTGTISNNTISGNEYGVLLRHYNSAGTAVPDVVVSSKNNLSGNTTAISSDVAANATENYWGHSTGPAVNDIKGNGTVSYAPWYTDAAMTTLEYSTTPNTNGDETTTTGSNATTLSGNSTQSGTVSVTADISASTTITGNSTWNGLLEAPVASTTSLSFQGYDTTVTSAISIGSSASDLLFSNPVKLVFSGQAGKSIGWYNQAGTFTEITETCTDANTPEVGSNQLSTTSPGESCKANSGSDLVVWTTHFSTFVTYSTTPAAPIISPNGGSFTGSVNVTMDNTDPSATLRYTTDGSSPICGGTGSTYTNGQTLTFTTTTTLNAIRCASGPVSSPMSSATFTITAASSGGGGGGGPIVGTLGVINGGTLGVTSGTIGGEVLGAAAYNFANNLTVGSQGTDVVELQKVLIAEGDLTISTPTGYFGPLTKAAVIKYQTAHSITPQSGYVGPLTRAVLNEGTTPTTPEVTTSSVGSSLTSVQIQAIISLLQSFGVDPATISNVSAVLHGGQ
ncbi:MAG: peptidoglycan-binding protein [Patescibacteria group bacterium]|nr:peptidoglycan-binding protein [Patescibacteria group bacterium]